MFQRLMKKQHNSAMETGDHINKKIFIAIATIFSLLPILTFAQSAIASGNYTVIVSQAYIYGYYGNNQEDAYFDKIPEGFYYPQGTHLFIYDEFKGYGRIMYPNKNGENVRGFMKMTDLEKE